MLTQQDQLLLLQGSYSASMQEPTNLWLLACRTSGQRLAMRSILSSDQWLASLRWLACGCRLVKEGPGALEGLVQAVSFCCA
jgi:hypothetical protein